MDEVRTGLQADGADGGVAEPADAGSAWLAGLTLEERGRVEEALSALRVLSQVSGLELASSVRAVVRDALGGGASSRREGLARAQSRGLVALGRHPGLPFSRATLYSLLRVGEQLLVLPPEIGQALTVKHHRALLTLGDPAAKRALAARAVAERWSSRTLLAAVQREAARSGRPGRVPAPTPIARPHIERPAPLRRALADLRSLVRAIVPARVLVPPSPTRPAPVDLRVHLDRLEVQLAALRVTLRDLPRRG